jgi:hypothetical protein
LTRWSVSARRLELSKDSDNRHLGELLEIKATRLAGVVAFGVAVFGANGATVIA